MRVKGQITVFMSLVIMCVFTLICGLLESARTAGARYYLQTAMASSLDSVFSQYHRQLWEDYRLLFAEYEDDQELEQDFDQFLRSYLQIENWYPMNLETTTVETFLTAVDNNGSYFEQEILDYMKYGIWNQEYQGTDVESLWKNIREADSVRAVAKEYRNHGNDALKLERVLENISESQKRQEQYKQEGLKALSRYDEPAFQRQVTELVKELTQMPGLVNAYSKQADALQRKLQESKQAFLLREETFQGETQTTLKQEMNAYDTYVEQDGTRRKEIEELKSQSQTQILFVKESGAMAREVEDMIQNWESDEDEDEPDLNTLWSPVIRQFQSVSINFISFAHGVKDKEKEGWLNDVMQMCEGGVLGLVLPEQLGVSTGVMDQTDIPSKMEIWSPGGRKTSLLDHMVINGYSGQFFPSFTNTREGTNTEEHLQYEMEYLLGGYFADEENLSHVVGRLLAVREGLNLLHILSDGKKRDEARTLAQVITGSVGITPLTAITTFFIMSVWALGESIVDIRGLLAKKKIPLWKTLDQWSLPLEELLQMGKKGDVITGGGGEGVDYMGWLKLLLMTEDVITQEYRMMDVIQMNIRKKQPGFRIRRGVYQVGLTSKLCGKHVFFSLGFVDKISGNPIHTYFMEATTERVY